MAGKILVIDDEKNIGELIQLAMKPKGYLVEYATSGGDGVSLFYRFSPDIVLVDKRLPDMDGIEAVQSLVQHRYAGSLVVCSGMPSSILRAASLIVTTGVFVVSAESIMRSFPLPPNQVTRNPRPFSYSRSRRP